MREMPFVFFGPKKEKGARASADRKLFPEWEKTTFLDRHSLYYPLGAATFAGQLLVFGPTPFGNAFCDW